MTAGATLTWSRSGGLSVEYPAPAAHVVEPRRVRPGADPVSHFAALMNQVVRDVCEHHKGAVAVELSGGLDSANVAVSVAQMSANSVRSGGLLVAGPTGRAQGLRRRIIIDHLGMRDLEVVAADHLPLALNGPRTVEHSHYPDTDIYQEAFDALRTVLRSAGTRVVFTGYGGDEIMARAPGERSAPASPPRLPPWLGQRARDALADVDANCSPVTGVALSTLVVFAARHPAYLRAGLWPTAPFSTPELSRFGRSLPVVWRMGKELLRQRLARTGLPLAVTHPRRPESFAATMNLALRSHASALLAALLDHSVLISQGYVRRYAVERLYRRASGGHTVPPLVYDMLALDIGIHSMCAVPAAGEGTACESSTRDR
ncbi:MAG: asparagine synthase-related protein [Pseudonocardia sp.]